MDYAHIVPLPVEAACPAARKLVAAPKEQPPLQVVAPPSPWPSSVSPAITLPQPKPHRCPTRRAASYSALSLEAATSRSATIAETP